MGDKTIFSMSGVLNVVYHEEQKAAVAHYDKLSTPAIREAIEKGLAAAGRAGAKTWIIDLTRNPGVPTQADAQWIETEAVRLVIANGISTVVNAHGASAVARIGSKRWTKSAEVSGLSIYDCDSLDAAVELAGQAADQNRTGQK
jgi:hypothetical protein